MRFHFILLAAACCFKSATCDSTVKKVTAVLNPTVTIASGMIVGTAVAVISLPSSTATVYNYGGIPYAAPPTGTRRWAPPAEPTPWTSPSKATALPPACMQQFIYPKELAEFTEKVFGNPGGPLLPESEDCLYLNVFAPTNASPSNRKPALFWIHGGNLMFGSGSLLIFNGSSFAGFQDVVVVTINYRTNIFGFSGSPEIPLGEQNSGFLDQRLALQWVQDNIPEFGGDPEKVILFGESARGYSVKQLLALPPTQPSFRATIIQSGGADLPAFPGTSFNHTAQYFGCNGSSSSLECLRQVSATDLKAYISQNGLLFPPVSDHITNIADVGPIITSNNFTDFPIMVGSNANEGRVAATGAGLQSKDNPTTIEVFLNNLFPNNATIRAVVKKAYTKLLNNVYLFASAVITDLGFTCRASSLANLAASNGYSVWRYYYNASFPALYSFPEAGACHSSEMPQVFGTYTVADQYGNVTRAQEKLSGYMQKTWANFANDPYNGLCWSPLGASHEDEMADLGGVDENGGTVVTTSTVDFICSLYGDLISASGH